MADMAVSASLLHDIQERRRVAFDENSDFITSVIRLLCYLSPANDTLNVLYHYRDSDGYRRFDGGSDMPVTTHRQRARVMKERLMPYGQKWAAGYTMDDGKNSIYEEPATNLMFNYLNNSNLSRVNLGVFEDLGITMGAFWLNSISDQIPFHFSRISGIILLPEYAEDYSDGGTFFWSRRVTEQWIREKKPGYVISAPDKNHIWVECALIDMRKEKGGFLFVIFEEKSDTAIVSEFTTYNRLLVLEDHRRPGAIKPVGIALEMYETIMAINEIQEGLNHYSIYSSKPAIAGRGNLKIDRIKRDSFLAGMLGFNNELLIKAILYELPMSEIRSWLEELKLELKSAFAIDPMGDLDGSVRTLGENRERVAETERSIRSDLSSTVWSISRALDSLWHLLTERGLTKGMPENIQWRAGSPDEKTDNQRQINNLVSYADVGRQVLGDEAFAMYNDPQKTLSMARRLLELPDDIASDGQQQQQQQQQQVSGDAGGVTSTAGNPDFANTPQIAPVQPGDAPAISGFGY